MAGSLLVKAFTVNRQPCHFEPVPTPFHQIFTQAICCQEMGLFLRFRGLLFHLCGDAGDSSFRSMCFMWGGGKILSHRIGSGATP